MISFSGTPPLISKTSPLTFQKVTHTNLEPLTKLYRTYTNEDATHQHTLQTVQAFLKNQMAKGSEFILGLWHNKPVAFIGYKDEPSTVSLKPKRIGQGVFVEKEYRGKGIGSALLQHLQQLLSKDNLRKYTIKTKITNTLQQKLYERLGFKPTFIEYEYKPSSI